MKNHYLKDLVWCQVNKDEDLDCVSVELDTGDLKDIIDNLLNHILYSPKDKYQLSFTGTLESDPK